MLFNEKGNTLERLINEVNSEDRNVISRFIHDVISWLKTKLNGEKVRFKIIRLENRFAAVLRNVDNANTQKNNTTNDGDVQYEFNDGVNSESKAIIREIKDNISKIPTTNIFNVYSEEVPNNIKKSQYVLDIFNSQGGRAKNSLLGEVELARAGAKSTVLHGFGKNKLAAVKAIKNVIENGTSIGYYPNYENSGVDRYIFAAKGQIDGKDSFVGVVVKAYPQNKNSKAKFYLHEALTTETDSPIMTAPQLSVDTVSESVSNPNVSQETPEVNTHYTQESENYSSPEQNNDGNSYSFGDIDKEGKKRDNISRANKTGELINEFYYALDKSEWNLFYRKIAESGFLEKTDVGDRVAIAIGGKLLIADRQLKGTDAHDFQIVAAYQEENGDWYVTNEIADIINESEDVYDKSRIESTIIRLGKKIDETSIFNRYDREHGEFVNNTYKRANGSRSTTTDGGHRTRTYGEGISSPVKQNTQRINAGLDNSAFSMPENDDVKYSFEDDVVDKTSSLAERVRLGEISQTEYLNELQRLMNEATEKYGAIPKGENPKVGVTVPKQVSDKRNTRRFVRTVLELGALT